jgi:3-hydroxymyristoyl/3-hydroxydecanoyl-(acyl carrier protein) dehydratase
MSVVEPIVTSERVSAPSAEIAFTVPADLDYFRGHFPGVPVVPGVIQIKWALGFARSRLGVAGEFAGMDGLKFHRVMTPGATVTLQLEYRAGDGQLRFSFGSGEIRYSSGSLRLRASP